MQSSSVHSQKYDQTCINGQLCIMVSCSWRSFSYSPNAINYLS